MMTRISISSLSLLVLLGAVASTSAADADSAEFYNDKVLPILEARCFECHGPESELKGGLFLGNRDGFLEGGESGPAVDTDALEDSLFIDAINYGSYEMPPDSQLPDDEIAVLTAWVKAGAVIPKDSEFERPEIEHSNPATLVNEETKNYWAFRPVVNPAVPQVTNSRWGTTPIDNFILRKLEQAKLSPAPRAEKQQLIRRAYYDLTGLPPSIDDIEAFVSDKSDRAFEKVIDRLLDSPHYGERWGRHWLDLVRYAESNSYERDGTKPFIWRYRDYVIKSFNEDKPYTQFIKEQLAGDEFEPPTPDSIVATGYYRLGIWDGEPVSQKQALYDDLDDILLTTSQVFLGLTMNCARCHDHKIDPLPQKDYYSFLAFFSGFRRYGVRSHPSVEDNSIGPIAVKAKDRDRNAARKALDRELADQDRKINNVNRRLQQLMTPPEKEDFRAVEVRVDIARKYEGKGLSKKVVAEYTAAVQRRKEILDTRPPEVAQALIIKEVGKTPRDTFILVRGNANVEGAKVEPAFPSVLSPPDPVIKAPTMTESSGRRTALANWIASEKNQLTARVMVNRIWQHHFGRGIVGSSNNFGNIGDKPTHPELLDWLASELIDSGWSTKHIHRLILTSGTWQQSSLHSEATKYSELDSTNRLWWRANRRRLDAESLRDSLLAVSGEIDLRVGGEGFKPTITAEALEGFSRKGAVWQAAPPEQQRRRSLYIFVSRSLMPPMMTTFDQCDTTLPCGQRDVTTTPTQALAMLNNSFVHDRSEALAERIALQADSADEQISAAWRAVLGRNPTASERQIATNHLQLQQTRFATVSMMQQKPLPVTTGLPAPVLHLSAGTGVTTDDSGKVVKWDSTTGQHHASQPESTSRPVLVPDAINGQSVLRFDGNQRFLHIDGELLSSDQCTIVAVASDTASKPGLREIISNWNREQNVGTSVFVGLRDTNTIRFSDNFNSAGTIRDVSKPFLLTVRNSPEGAFVWQSRSQIASRAQALANRRLGTKWVIGQQGNINGEYWYGDIAELYVFDKPLSSAELNTLWSQLIAKYDLAEVVDDSPDIVRDTSPEHRSLASLCHVLLNSNEFLYVD